MSRKQNFYLCHVSGRLSSWCPLGNLGIPKPIHVLQSSVVGRAQRSDFDWCPLFLGAVSTSGCPPQIFVRVLRLHNFFQNIKKLFSAGFKVAHHLTKTFHDSCFQIQSCGRWFENMEQMCKRLFSDYLRPQTEVSYSLEYLSDPTSCLDSTTMLNNVNRFLTMRQVTFCHSMQSDAFHLI